MSNYIKREFKRGYNAAKKAWDRTPQKVKYELKKAGVRAAVIGVKKGASVGTRYFSRLNKAYNQKRRKGRYNSKVSAVSGHNDLSANSFSNSLNPGKLQKHLGMYTYKVTKQLIQNQVAGVQSVFEGKPIVMRSQFNGTVDTGAASNNFPDDPFQLNPYVNSPNAIYSGPMPVVASTSLLGLSSVTHEMTMLNLETSAVQVHIMYVLCKDDTDKSPTVAWNDGLFQSSENQAAITYRTTLANITSAGAGESIYSYGQTPYKVRMFKKYWKTIAEQKFILNGGDQKRISTKFNYKKFLSRAVLAAGGGIYMAGFTIIPLIIVRGAVVGVSTGADVASTEVTYASCRVGLLQTDKYNLCGMPAQLAEVRTRRVEGQLVNLDAGLVEKIIDDEDDVEVVKSA